MKRFLALLALPLAAFAQSTITPTVSPSTAKAGDTVTVTINYPTADPAGMVSTQWTVALPWPATATARGSAATSAAKTLAVNGLKALIYSKDPATNALNQNVIPSGALATYTVPIPANASPGNYTITVSGIEGVTSAGVPFSLVAGSPAVVALLSSFDLNNDGVVDYKDVDLAAAQAIGTAACGTGDVNVDSKCSATDVVLVTRKALGL